MSAHGAVGAASPGVTAALAKRAVPILLTVFVFSLVIDNAFKYVTNEIAGTLDLSLNTASLQATIPGLLIGIGAVVYSALADSIAIRKLLVLAIILITVGSIIGFAFQTNWPLVLTGRIVQTAGLAAAETLYVIWVTKYFKGDQQKMYLGFSTAAFQLSLLLGVVGGGFIAQSVSWPVLFLVALLPLLALPVVLKTVPNEETSSSNLDVYGLFLIAVVAGGIILFLQDFQWLYLVAAVAGLVLFVLHIKKSPNALVSPAFFANKQYTLVLLVVFVMYSVQLGYVVIYPVVMGATHEMDSAQASLLLIPGYICAILVGVFTGAIAKFLSSNQAIIAALSAITLALVLPTFLINAGVWVFVLSMALFPSGFALMYGPLVSTAVKRIAPEKTGVAIGFYNLTINMAVPIGIAYTFNIFDQGLTFMSPISGADAAPFASTLAVLAAIAALALLMYFAFARTLHREEDVQVK